MKESRHTRIRGRWNSKVTLAATDGTVNRFLVAVLVGTVILVGLIFVGGIRRQTSPQGIIGIKMLLPPHGGVTVVAESRWSIVTAGRRRRQNVRQVVRIRQQWYANTPEKRHGCRGTVLQRVPGHVRQIADASEGVYSRANRTLRQRARLAAVCALPGPHAIVD